MKKWKIANFFCLCEGFQFPVIPYSCNQVDQHKFLIELTVMFSKG